MRHINDDMTRARDIRAVISRDARNSERIDIPLRVSVRAAPSFGTAVALTFAFREQ